MKKPLAIAFALATFAFNANAGIFDGKSVEVTYFFPDLSTVYGGPNTYAVGPGVEVSDLVDGVANLDIQSDGFTANFFMNGGFSPGAFNGFRITDVNGTIDAFTSFSLAGNTAFNFGAPVLSFDANNLYVNWSDLSFQAGDVQFAVNNLAPVPEPETYAMLLAGLGLLGVVARRRKHKEASA